MMVLYFVQNFGLAPRDVDEMPITMIEHWKKYANEMQRKENTK